MHREYENASGYPFANVESSPKLQPGEDAGRAIPIADVVALSPAAPSAASPKTPFVDEEIKGAVELFR